jgi:hypothetical protein
MAAESGALMSGVATKSDMDLLLEEIEGLRGPVERIGAEVLGLRNSNLELLMALRRAVRVLEAIGAPVDAEIVGAIRRAEGR